ncbi:acyltransferase family protein [Cohnella candidum]|nr:acyltransferase [Cohnella candidum]
MQRRIEQLDGLRGLASFTVMLHHLYLVFPFLPLLFRYSPLRVVVNGHASVILFFVLSGYVLALPFMERSGGSYRSFVIRRIFRIYVPYLVSVILATLMASWLASGRIPGIDAWQRGIHPGTLAGHLFLVADTDTKALNNVMWSLVHEMRISLLFPLITLCVLRWGWRANLLVCLLLSASGGLKTSLPWGHEDITLWDTLHYAAMFLIGAMLAKNKSSIAEAYRKLTALRKWKFLIAAFPLYAYSTVIASAASKMGFMPYDVIISDYAAAIAAAVWIVYAVNSTRLSKQLLLRKPVVFLGRISYSLYLYHLIVLFSLMFAFYGTLPNAVIYAGTIVLSLLLSALSHRFVERPAIAWGRRFADRPSRTQIGRPALTKES